ncbi:MAG: serine/threonine-protein kinase, partial [Planctomycetota bacterium]
MSRIAQTDLDAALDRQRTAWLSGSRPNVEDLLRDTSLPPEPDVLLDLIYNEIVVREQLGETPVLDEYVTRFPRLGEDLKLHFEVHSAVHENLVDTNFMTEGKSGDVSLDFGPCLANYEIIRELGRGGMGVVYKARHRRLKRLVAIKMFHPGRQPTPRERARFRTEAEAVARLAHPNVVQIFEIGEESGMPFLAIELAENGTLQDKLLDRPFEAGVAAELIETLARAIHHAHQQHVIHRDLKPTNILFTADDAPKITDFGLAKIVEENSAKPGDRTRSGEALGTPRYMSPEQALGRIEQIGPATDIYALGTMLYECLTGQPPFVSPSVVETIDRIRNEEPLPPRRMQRAIPRDLETICLYCLHKQPARRYASALDLADDLRHFADGEPISARRTPAWERAWMWCRRRPSIATL